MARTSQPLLGGARQPPSAASFLIPVCLAALCAKSAFLAVPHPGVALQASGLDSAAHSRQSQLAALTQILAESHGARGARRMSLADDEEEDPDEAGLRGEMGRGWFVRSAQSPQMGSSAGGPGMPLAAVKGVENEDDLKKLQFGHVVKQRQFRDAVVDARTGKKVDLSDEDKKELKRQRMMEEAKEQEDMDSLSSFMGDAQIPAQYIYPDGESVVPPTVKVKFRGIQDKHVGADGETTFHEGPMWGVFRQNPLGKGINASHGRFNKWGEGLGFRDRPLPVRDVDYEDIRDKQLEALQNQSDAAEARRERYLAQQNSAGKLYCSGKECDEVWGKAGMGDEVIDLDTGEAVYKGVGPGGEAPTDQEAWELDRHVDPHTGSELKHCIGPQCKGMTWAFPEIKDEQGPNDQSHAVFGRAQPTDRSADPQEIRTYQKEGWDGDEGGADDENDENEPEGEDDEEEDEDKYPRYAGDPEAGPGFVKDWNAGSWVGFIILGEPPSLSTF